MKEIKMEEQILTYFESSKLPITISALSKKLRIKNEQRKLYIEAVNKLLAVKKLKMTRGKVSPSTARRSGRQILKDIDRSKNAVLGTVVKVLESYGFVAVEGMDDVFVPGRKMLGSLPGDKVLVTVKKSPGHSSEGEVVKITVPAEYTFSGEVLAGKRGYCVHPDKNLKFEIECVGSHKGAKEGDKVLAKMVRGKGGHFTHKAEIIEVFGNKENAKTCSKAALAELNIKTEFSAEALERAKQIASTPVHEKELLVRKDYRNEIIFTIDSAESKDLDDAISLKKTPGGWLLGVHIADVSYFVTRQDALDLEAFERGTSVYYANEVIPMLPKEISNGICSLNEGEDRLAFSALLTLDAAGALVSYRFEKSVIKSAIKGIYSEINSIFDGSATEETMAKYRHVEATLRDMKELSELRKQLRFNRGALELASVESKFIFDKNSKVTDIVARKQGTSEEMIEDFMLVANEAAAKFGAEHELPFVYRIHAAPPSAKSEVLKEVLQAVGISTLPIQHGVTQQGLNKILDFARGTNYYTLVNDNVLRSMSKAKYLENPEGHFGLALEDYAHFTSPIRRYPDLIIHRIMSAYLMGMRRTNIEKNFREFVSAASASSTAAEIKAMSAERECESFYKAEYMKKFVGKNFTATISGVTNRGIFVMLENTVQGYISTADLPAGEYSLNGGIALVNTLGGQSYKIGEKMDVILVAADISSGNIDFAPAQ